MRDRIISADPFSKRYVSHQYKTKQICDSVVDDCLTALKFVLDWFVTSKMKKFFFTLMKIYSILMKILVMLYLLVMEWVFLI